MWDGEGALRRIHEADAGIGAFTGIDEGGVLAGPRADGPLAGVLVGVKELVAVAGLPWTCGSRVRAGAVAERDAPLVAALRDAGAVVAGVTRSHEFAWGLPTWHERLGGPRNPYDPTRTTGGSSGGSAAAVASGAVPVAIGTDTGCSVRLPAAFCGVVGVKPTYGIVPLDGVVPLSRSYDHGGVVAATVADARRVLGALGVPTTSPGRRLDGLRVGVADRPLGTPLPSDRQHCLDAAVAAVTALGAYVVPVRLPDGERLVRTYVTMVGFEGHRVHRDELRTWPGRRVDYGTDLQERLEAAESVTAEDYAAALRELAAIRHETARVLGRVDLLLGPVAACGPTRVASPHVADVGGVAVPLRDAVLPYTVLADLCGLPAVAVPAGRDDDGLPVGVQLAGRPWADALVLDAADALHAALPPLGPPPPPPRRSPARDHGTSGAR